MPILIDSEPGAPLAQGDLLKDVRVFHSGADGGAHEIQKRPYCLIVSRDCNAEHDPNVIVAPVRQLPDTLPSDKGFAFFKRFLAQLRDGTTQTDGFYLGNVPGNAERLIAKLNELASVGLPEAGDQTEWVAKRRVARMHRDALRALQSRLFWSFAKPGFHDYEWYPTPDLTLLISAADSDESQLAAELKQRELDLATEENNPNRNEKKIVSLTRNRDTAQSKLTEFRAQLAPFRTELSERK